MKSSDPYAETDRLDDSLLQVIVTRLETRGRHPEFEKMLIDYLNAMHIDTARTVLDMGCGTVLPPARSPAVSPVGSQVRHHDGAGGGCLGRRPPA